MMQTGEKGKRTATSAVRAIALAVVGAVAGLSGIVTQSLAEPIITTQSITPPGTPPATPAPQATTKSPAKPPAKSLTKPPMAKPTSPPPTPSKPVTPPARRAEAGAAATRNDAAGNIRAICQAGRRTIISPRSRRSSNPATRSSRAFPARRTMRHRSRSPMPAVRQSRSNRRPRRPRKRSSNPASCRTA